MTDPVQKISLPNEVMLSEVANLLQEGHDVVILTKGFSMLPFIVGDRDSVRLVRKDTYVPGDIVLAKLAPGRWVLHRLIQLSSDGAAVLKGDGNLIGTESCAIADIKGAAVEIIRPKSSVDCTAERFRRTSLRWREAPYLFRRIVLAFYHRIILKFI